MKRRCCFMELSRSAEVFVCSGPLEEAARLTPGG